MAQSKPNYQFSIFLIDYITSDVYEYICVFFGKKYAESKCYFILSSRCIFLVVMRPQTSEVLDSVSQSANPKDLFLDGNMAVTLRNTEKHHAPIKARFR